MNAEKLPPRLRVASEIFGCDIEGTRRKSLIDGNIYTADPSPVHSYMRDQVPARVDNCDIHRLPDFPRLFFCRCNYSARRLQIDHVQSSPARIKSQTLRIVKVARRSNGTVPN